MTERQNGYGLSGIGRNGVAIATKRDCKWRSLMIDPSRYDPPLTDPKKAAELERAIWIACWDLWITTDEAVAAIEHYCGARHNT